MKIIVASALVFSTVGLHAGGKCFDVDVTRAVSALWKTNKSATTTGKGDHAKDSLQGVPEAKSVSYTAKESKTTQRLKAVLKIRDKAQTAAGTMNWILSAGNSPTCLNLTGQASMNWSIPGLAGPCGLGGTMALGGSLGRISQTKVVNGKNVSVAMPNANIYWHGSIGPECGSDVVAQVGGYVNMVAKFGIEPYGSKAQYIDSYCQVDLYATAKLDVLGYNVWSWQSGTLSKKEIGGYYQLY